MAVPHQAHIDLSPQWLKWIWRSMFEVTLGRWDTDLQRIITSMWVCLLTHAYQSRFLIVITFVISYRYDYLCAGSNCGAFVSPSAGDIHDCASARHAEVKKEEVCSRFPWKGESWTRYDYLHIRFLFATDWRKYFNPASHLLLWWWPKRIKIGRQHWGRRHIEMKGRWGGGFGEGWKWNVEWKWDECNSSSVWLQDLEGCCLRVLEFAVSSVSVVAPIPTSVWFFYMAGELLTTLCFGCLVIQFYTLVPKVET